MLNAPEVSDSTLTSIYNRNARTDNIRPLAWMLFVFVLSCFGLALGVTQLKQFQPPQNPVWNLLFLDEGTHRWVLGSQEQCEGFIVGGWKKSKKIGERIWFKFKIPAQGQLSAQSGELSAKFGDYKNLVSMKGRLNGKELSFYNNSWSGFNSPPRELLLLVDAPGDGRLLKLPSPWNSEFNSFLAAYINEKRKLIEVDKDQFFKCVKELQS